MPGAATSKGPSGCIPACVPGAVGVVLTEEPPAGPASDKVPEAAAVSTGRVGFAGGECTPLPVPRGVTSERPAPGGSGTPPSWV